MTDRNIDRLIAFTRAMPDHCVRVRTLLGDATPLPLEVEDLLPTGQDQKLFELVKENGPSTFAFYHYTDDFHSLDPNAQVDIMRYFGAIIEVNALLQAPPDVAPTGKTIPRIVRTLDRIIAQSVFFERFFSRHDFGAEVLLNRKKPHELAPALNALKNKDEARSGEVVDMMAEPDRITEYVPRDDVPFLISAERAYEDGQKDVNGVYFPKAEGEQLLAHLAQQQAAELKNRSPNARS